MFVSSKIKEKMEEEWRKVPSFRRIEVSNLGNVRTIWPHKVKDLKQMEMKATVGTYLKVSVTEIETGKQVQIGVHNLIAEAFVPKPVKKEGLTLEPNHNDGNKHNNRSDNLEWMTRRENLQHAIDTGLRKIVDENGKCLHIDKSKAVKALNVETSEVIRCASAKEMSDRIGIPARTIQYNAFDRKVKKPVKGYVISKDE